MMKLTVTNDNNDKKEVGFIWGTGAFLNTCDKLGLPIGQVQLGILDPKIFLTITHEAVLLFIKKNKLDFELSFDAFVESFDLLTKEQIDSVYQDYLASTYQGASMKEHYIEFGFEFKEDDEARKKNLAKKKKHQSQKLSSTSSAGDTQSNRQRRRQSRNTKQST